MSASSLLATSAITLHELPDFAAETHPGENGISVFSTEQEAGNYVYFTYAGNIYLSAKKDGKISYAPDDWHILSEHSHYFESAPGFREPLAELLYCLRRFDYSRGESSLITRPGLSEDRHELADIILNLEQRASDHAALYEQIGHKLPTHEQLNAVVKEGIADYLNHQDDHAAARKLERLTLFMASGKPFFILGPATNEPYHFYHYEPAPEAAAAAPESGGTSLEAHNPVNGVFVKTSVLPLDTVNQKEERGVHIQAKHETISAGEFLARYRNDSPLMVHAPDNPQKLMRDISQGIAYGKQLRRSFDHHDFLDDVYGTELTAETMQTNSFYRIFSASDYTGEPQGGIQPPADDNQTLPAPEATIADHYRTLDTAKAAYLIVIRQGFSSSYTVLYTAPDGGATTQFTLQDPSQLQAKLQQLGISQNQRLINIGEDEFRDLRQSGRLGEADLARLDQLEKEMVDRYSVTRPTPLHPFEHISIPGLLTEPLPAHGNAEEQIAQLRTHTVYKTANENEYILLERSEFSDLISPILIRAVPSGEGQEPDHYVVRYMDSIFAPANLEKTPPEQQYFKQSFTDFAQYLPGMREATAEEISAILLSPQRFEGKYSDVLGHALTRDLGRPQTALPSNYAAMFSWALNDLQRNQTVESGQFQLSAHADKDNVPYLAFATEGHETAYFRMTERGWKAVETETPTGLSPQNIDDPQFLASVRRQIQGIYYSYKGVEGRNSCMKAGDTPEWLANAIDRVLPHNIDIPKENAKPQAKTEEAARQAAPAGNAPANGTAQTPKPDAKINPLPEVGILTAGAAVGIFGLSREGMFGKVVGALAGLATVVYGAIRAMEKGREHRTGSAKATEADLNISQITKDFLYGISAGRFTSGSTRA